MLPIDVPSSGPEIGLIISAIGVALVGVWRCYQIACIEINLKRREAEGWTPPARTEK